MADSPAPPDVTPPDDTRHGPVPPMGPSPRKTIDGRDPNEKRNKTGDTPDLPPARAPFPDRGGYTRNVPPKSS
jgi:hypothetical protein